jgi:hypothetical protein
VRSGSAALLILLASAIAVPAPCVASAAPSLMDRVKSDRLFREGKRLYSDGKYKEACEALAQSEALEPAIGTLGLLAACHEKQGDLLKAQAAYEETAKRAQAKKDSRGAFASERAAALKLRLAKLSIRSAGKEPGLEVKRGDEVLLASQLGVEESLNPGVYAIEASAPGKPAWRTKITLKEGERRVVLIPLLDPVAREAAASPGPPRWIAYAAGGVGVAGIIAGSIAGSLAISNNDASMSRKVCLRSASRCPAREAALTAATVSTASFSVGVAGVAAGAVLFFLSRPRGGSSSDGGSDDAASKKSAAAIEPGRFASVRIVPSVGPEGTGAVVLGAF